MTRNVKTVADALAETPAAAHWLSRLRASQSAARLLAEASPPIGGGFDPLRPGACELRGKRLLLTATSPAQAAKLRQQCPRLQTLLGQQGLEISEVRVRLQPAPTSYREEASTANRVQTPGEASAHPPGRARDLSAPLRFADELALTLRDSPLRAAVEKLRATLREAVTKIR